MIIKEGDKFCVKTKDGSKTLGCHDTEEEALAQLRAVEASKHAAESDPFIPLKTVESICPPCAQKMRQRNLSSVRLSEVQKAVRGEINTARKMELAANKLKDFLPLPILRVGKTKNKGMEITDDIFSEVAQTYNPLIHEAPIVREPHENTDAGLKEKNRAGEALGWIKQLGVVDIEGEKFLSITDAKASSPEYEDELIRLLSGPMKHNSPELDTGSHLETEFYGPEGTGEWPEAAKNKYYLRRVNLYGAHPIAQFGMPQANLSELQLSESGDKFYTFTATQNSIKGATMPEEKKEEPKAEIQLADLQSKIAALEKANEHLQKQAEKSAIDLAEERRLRRRDEIADQLEEMVEEGKITKAQFDHALELACRVDAEKSPLKFSDSDGKEVEETMLDSFMFVLSNSPMALNAGALEVVGRQIHSEKKNEEVIAEKEKQLKAEHPEWKPTQVYREAVKLAQNDSRYRRVSVYAEGGRK